MQPLRIGDAFEQSRVDSDRFEEIVGRLKSYEASTIRTGPAYDADKDIYLVRFYDQGHIYNPKLLQYRQPIEITETELYAVQDVFRAALTLESKQITAKLDEAERRINDAKDYIAEERREKQATKEKIEFEVSQPYQWPGLQKT